MSLFDSEVGQLFEMRLFLRILEEEESRVQQHCLTMLATKSQYSTSVQEPQTTL